MVSVISRYASDESKTFFFFFERLISVRFSYKDLQGVKNSRSSVVPLIISRVVVVQKSSFSENQVENN